VRHRNIAMLASLMMSGLMPIGSGPEIVTEPRSQPSGSPYRTPKRDPPHPPPTPEQIKAQAKRARRAKKLQEAEKRKL